MSDYGNNYGWDTDEDGDTCRTVGATCDSAHAYKQGDGPWRCMMCDRPTT